MSARWKKLKVLLSSLVAATASTTGSSIVAPTTYATSTADHAQGKYPILKLKIMWKVDESDGPGPSCKNCCVSKFLSNHKIW